MAVVGVIQTLLLPTDKFGLKGWDTMVKSFKHFRLTLLFSKFIVHVIVSGNLRFGLTLVVLDTLMDPITVRRCDRFKDPGPVQNREIMVERN